MFSSLIKTISTSLSKSIIKEQRFYTSKQVVAALRNRKPKSDRVDTVKSFVDFKSIRTIGGKGGNGEISFLQLWANENGGPDGGDGGNGGHVIFQACSNVNNLNHIARIMKAEDGERGYNRDCFGKNAEHAIIQVPVGTIVRDFNGKVVADLNKEHVMFVAARGGAGGHGNHFFTSDTEQAPKVAEIGAMGEDLNYSLEIRSMADFGLVGFPNAGKSTLLRAISRARPKVASYPFTTLQPHLGIVQFVDYERFAVADLPGLIEGSHKNRGLGIKFLKHAERCTALVFLLDLSCNEPWEQLNILLYEIKQFSPELASRPQIVVGNKIDLLEAKDNLKLWKTTISTPIIEISARQGINLQHLLSVLREMNDEKLSLSQGEENKI